MKLTFNQQVILLLVAGFLLVLFTSFAKNEPVIENKTIVTAGSDIEIQYSGGQKFYVLKSGYGGNNVAFIKAN